MNKFGDTMRLVKQAREIQKQLKQTEIAAENKEGTIAVVFNGESHLKSLRIDESWLEPAKKLELERGLVSVIGQAISQSQAVAAEQMKKVAGDLNIPGMSR